MYHIAVVAYPCHIEAEEGQVEGDRAPDGPEKKTKRKRKK